MHLQSTLLIGPWRRYKHQWAPSSGFLWHHSSPPFWLKTLDRSQSTSHDDRYVQFISEIHSKCMITPFLVVVGDLMFLLVMYKYTELTQAWWFWIIPAVHDGKIWEMALQPETVHSLYAGFHIFSGNPGLI